MKNLLLFILIVFSCLSFGQVTDSNLSEANRALLIQLNEQENERINRVQNFLQNHPNVKATLINDGFTLMHIHDVRNGKPIYRSTENLEAARATKTVELWTGGSLGLDLDGLGMTVGVWDGGPADDGHVEFENDAGTDTRMEIIDPVVVDGDTGFSSHGTHVAGTISANGTNPSARGMASRVNVKSFNWTNDSAEMTTEAGDLASPMLVSNHSYGVPINQGNGNQLDADFIGAYSSGAATVDNITRNNPKYLPVMSAGNSGNVSYPGGMFPGFDKLTGDKNAKNSLIVANANPIASEQPAFSGNYELTSLAINSGSSEGPTDDLRIKPDIAADGTNLLSPTPANGYSTFSGTSMSSPNTAGTLILLQQYYNQLFGEYMNSATLKSLVCHTAIDEFDVNPVNPNHTMGPDPVFGWGLLNARAAAQTIASANNSLAVIDELNLAQGDTYTFTFSAQAGSKLSATICWTDLPGPIANGPANDPTPRLVNDLDLRISDGTTTFLPWRLNFDPVNGFTTTKADNSVDNIERVDIEVPTNGMYTLTVSHKGNIQGGGAGPFDPGNQDFSLIITGNNLVLSVDENDLSRNLTVYPNPSKGEFTIAFESNLNSVDNTVKVDVYDLQGRLVYNNNFMNTASLFKETITLENAKAGVYMVNISEGNRTTSHKLIIQ
ncbi:hypothetical protein BWZ20_11705 [Winogradskyella sp. J14-2]|uniref:S8 family serine peptidase n=1 Tax=Winogradskyella sp. J14-2 TaxID=1936080 RepID=UPI000972856F|nr:S8 family serine peptidase [Winogradskyella sp. J14-2]APY08925.1 hypothetical protein BWZ20_11705 [Winogradskyella sp. J14-2]